LRYIYISTTETIQTTNQGTLKEKEISIPI